MGETLTWVIGGMVFFLFALLFSTMISLVKEALIWVKRRWL